MAINLREKLNKIIPEIVQKIPGEIVKGTELIKLVRFRLEEMDGEEKQYSDATLRYYFTMMSRDYASPIARVDKGQGYYLRKKRVGTSSELKIMSDMQMSLFDDDSSNYIHKKDILLGRLEKFHQIFLLLNSDIDSFPCIIEVEDDPDADLPSPWSNPDALTMHCVFGNLNNAVVNHAIPANTINIVSYDDNKNSATKTEEVNTSVSDDLVNTENLANILRLLNFPLTKITAYKLVLELTPTNFHNYFFQALSSCRWAHESELICLHSIDNELVKNSLARLGQEFGVGIKSLELDGKLLDNLPTADRIKDFSESETEHLLGKITPKILAYPKHREILQSRTLAEHLQNQSSPICKTLSKLAKNISC